jgi:hypothetical protein
MGRLSLLRSLIVVRVDVGLFAPVLSLAETDLLVAIVHAVERRADLDHRGRSLISLRVQPFPPLFLCFTNQSRTRGQVILRLVLRRVQSVGDPRYLDAAFFALLTLAVTRVTIYYLHLPLEFIVALEREEALLTCFRSLRIVGFALDRGVLRAILAVQLSAVLAGPLDVLERLLHLVRGEVDRLPAVLVKLQ